ncbi:hypothetical protein EVA_20848 [gut metagenome]|uniref:Uncharacterized protein n=1 Tax=gut metagenome TaxID=749906 RepID=J9BU39_9ZZZZ
MPHCRISPQSSGHRFLPARPGRPSGTTHVWSRRPVRTGWGQSSVPRPGSNRW